MRVEVEEGKNRVFHRSQYNWEETELWRIKKGEMRKLKLNRYIP